MAADDFGAQLGSMDRNQLKELMQYLSDTTLGAHQVQGAAGDGPAQYRGSGLPTYRDFANRAKGSFFGGEEVKNSVGRLGIYGQYLHGKRSAKAKKEKAEWEAAQAQAIKDQNLVNQERLKSVTQQLRTLDTRDKVNQQFQDLNLEGLFDRVSQQGLDSNIQGITQQHADLSRETGFDTVGRGLGGSSVDATRAADVQSSQNQAVAQAAAQAQSQRAGMTANANAQRQNLLNSVSGANPGEDARVQNEIQGIGQDANAYSTQAGLTQFGMGQNQQAMNGYSQALGGMLTNYANMYTMQNQNTKPKATPGYGG